MALICGVFKFCRTNKGTSDGNFHGLKNADLAITILARRI
jgi:hypothetical protein